MKQIGYQQGLDPTALEMLEAFEETVQAEYEHRKHHRTHMHLHQRKSRGQGGHQRRTRHTLY